MDEPLHHQMAASPRQRATDNPAGAAPAPSPIQGERSMQAAEDDFPIETSEHEQPEEEVWVVPNFERQLELLLEDAFPVFMDRLKRVHFADWHRRSGLELDLAQGAMLAVFRQCRDKHFMPADIVGYLVTTARHMAISDWKERRKGPVRFADLEHLPSKPGTRRSGRVVVCEEEADHGQREAEDWQEGEQDEKYRQEDDTAADGQPEPLRGSDEEESGDALVEEDPETYLAEPTGDDSNATRDGVRAAIEKLPRRQREAVEIYMRHSEECTFVQMSAMMVPPISADGFEKNVERAWKTLREHLHSQGLTRP